MRLPVTHGQFRRSDDAFNNRGFGLLITRRSDHHTVTIYDACVITPVSTSDKIKRSLQPTSTTLLAPKNPAQNAAS